MRLPLEYVWGRAMQLPGQLRDTTLGDLLGALFREEAEGTLELLEVGGREHRITLRHGRVEDVESDLEGPLLGELLHLNSIPAMNSGQRLGQGLLERKLISEEQLSLALRRQNRARLELLFDIEEASIRFRAPRPRSSEPAAPPMLSKEAVLRGRPRRRSRDTLQNLPKDQEREGALQVLGLSPSSSQVDIRQAFRVLAARLHPDRHPEASGTEGLQLRKQFAELSLAYHTLTA